MLPELDVDGQLPPGRYRVTQEEIYVRFVEDRPPRRHLLWGDWQAMTNLLRRYTPVNAAWLYGPFLTEIAEPPAIHCLYWVEDLELDKANLDPDAHNMLRAFASPGEVHKVVGVDVDTRLAAWHCQPDTQIDDNYYAEYLYSRGQVDDVLQRRRSGTAGSAPVRLDALPRRGYLEVTLDDYT
ncbi:DUF6932 family protein [Mycobacteroides abscessus]|uniref:DUF6932 family protein n=1 Tax=Mycobacteroides abscessus TaxID=36809 RepID=UPI00046D182B|nr:hypothetical protein [Mycobacteroides abscessus]MBE5494402.1 hypothetical protein [Mycobacteroides abscessus]SHP48599.1 Uncharacterised protein [Mycobacteroides abscessus subsp. abscessus]SHP49087.1 Uncharacterised protein [Mycobacteroides abscessus subsp. abscessus]SHP67888.1 Uncharacterised protein [Mycobacteroides abscessus subsp. abscessus]SHQ24131.1 Uncharacterised protein [Mycobacteroides abscessus subsp. abscessus]